MAGALSLAWIAVALSVGVASAADSAASYIEFSGSMVGIGGASFNVGHVSGSIYNKHATRTIRVTEVAINSSSGRRLFKVDHTVAPHDVASIGLSTGLHLDFAKEPKGWWHLEVTKAEWQQK